MPRNGKGGGTLSGAPAQAPKTPTGQTYGTGKRMLESQRQMPIPDYSSPGASGGPGPVPSGTPAQTNAAPNVPDVASLQAALAQIAGGGSVTKMPTERPGEPVTQPLAGQARYQRPLINDSLYELRALARRFPQYRDLLAFLDRSEREA